MCIRSIFFLFFASNFVLHLEKLSFKFRCRDHSNDSITLSRILSYLPLLTPLKDDHISGVLGISGTTSSKLSIDGSLLLKSLAPGHTY